MLCWWAFMYNPNIWFDYLSTDEINDLLDVYVMVGSLDRHADKTIAVFNDVKLLQNDEAITTTDSKLKYQDYTLKVIKYLRKCSSGSKEFCLMVEDDALYLYDNETTKKLILANILSFYGNYDYIIDCSKVGMWFDYTKVRGNNILCRITPAAEAECIASYMEQADQMPADLAYKHGANKCGLKERRFKIVEHIGYKSTIIHENE